MTGIVDRFHACVAALALLGLAACAAEEEGPREPRAVMLLSSADAATSLVFAAREYQDRLPEIAGAARPPKDFPWVSITIPEASAPALESEEGLYVDLTRSEEPVVFAQAYRDLCNPASDDDSRCWLFERYTAGEKGLSGSVSARLADPGAEARFEVAWEGMTDRFGAQMQWHRHITSAGVQATVMEVPR